MASGQVGQFYCFLSSFYLATNCTSIYQTNPSAEKNITPKKIEIKEETTICSLFAEMASQFPDRPAVEDEEHNIYTYKVNN